ncbi:hypothetical protein ACEB63_003490 [Raoultella planticola]
MQTFDFSKSHTKTPSTQNLPQIYNIKRAMILHHIVLIYGYRVVFINRINSNLNHIRFWLSGCAVFQHPAVVTNNVRSHNRAANTDFCPTLSLRLTQHMYVRKSSQAMPARHISARPI